MAAHGCGGWITSCGTKVVCKACDLVLDPVQAKQHFLVSVQSEPCTACVQLQPTGMVMAELSWAIVVFGVFVGQTPRGGMS
jgi:hypothetical protein